MTDEQQLKDIIEEEMANMKHLLTQISWQGNVVIRDLADRSLARLGRARKALDELENYFVGDDQ